MKIGKSDTFSWAFTTSALALCFLNPTGTLSFNIELRKCNKLIPVANTLNKPWKNSGAENSISEF